MTNPSTSTPADRSDKTSRFFSAASTTTASRVYAHGPRSAARETTERMRKEAKEEAHKYEM